MKIEWGKCNSGKWCNFVYLDLDHEIFKDLNGVYIIFNEKDGVIRIGSGDIKDRITKHRNDEKITKYKDLLVTWAKVNANQMEAVERFLADTYNAKVGDRFPDKTPIKVNLPFDE